MSRYHILNKLYNSTETFEIFNFETVDGCLIKFPNERTKNNRRRR